MAHPLYRRRYIQHINNAIGKFEEASEIHHPGLKGRIREIAVDELFKPILPPGIKVGSGKIVDSLGQESAEIDLIIYNPSILPPIMYSERDGIFPVEACLYTIEIKTTATATNLKDAISKFESVKKLRYTQAKRENNEIVYHSPLFIPVFFAFSTDLIGGEKTELDRYRSYDTETSPQIPVICVLGRGYWFYHSLSNKWYELGSTENHDEIIDFLCGVANSIPSLIERINPTIGDYLMSIDSNRFRAL